MPGNGDFFAEWGEGAAEMHPLWTIWGKRPKCRGNRPEYENQCENCLDFHGVQSDQYHTQKEKEDHIMILNTHPENRKEMVKVICELTGMNA